MFLPPEDRRTWHPPKPPGKASRRGEAVLLWMVGAFLLSVLLGPIGGSTLIQALLALVHR